jgi:hypothetical protein
MKYEYAVTRLDLHRLYGQKPAEFVLPPDSRGWRMRDSSVVTVETNKPASFAGGPDIMHFTSMIVMTWELAIYEGIE